MGAMYSTATSGWTPVAHADAASSLADNSYHGLRTETSNQIRVSEVFIGGEATSSTVNRMAVRRLSTNASTPTNKTPGPMHPWSAASAANHYSAATTGPTIASTVHLLDLALNVFGGIIRWVAHPGEELYALNSTAPNGEIALDSISGTGVVSTNMVFEEM